MSLSSRPGSLSIMGVVFDAASKSIYVATYGCLTVASAKWRGELLLEMQYHLVCTLFRCHSGDKYFQP
jgi:hypothetical protein